MSNQPKIIYRSDTTGCLYMMQLNNSHFTIIIDCGTYGEYSKPYEVVMPWRKSIDLFFDLVDHHINTGKWAWQEEELSMSQKVR